MLYIISLYIKRTSKSQEELNLRDEGIIMRIHKSIRVALDRIITLRNFPFKAEYHSHNDFTLQDQHINLL